MVALTYATATPAGTARKVTKTAAPAKAARKTFFARFFDAVMEARMRQAQREIRLYTRALPEDSPFGPQDKSGTPRGGW